MQRITFSMNESPLSTQQMLLDHLHRIVQGAHVSELDTDEERWWFGFGDDCLVSRDKEQKTGDEDRRVNEARLLSFLQSLAVMARDRPSGPGDKFVKKAASRFGNKELAKIPKKLAKIFDGLNHQFFRTVLPENADADTLQQVYAFEMLDKLGMVAERSKTEVVQEILLLENVPERVDNYMAEAAVCFRYGLDRACLAVCRSALEQILIWKIVCARGKEALQKPTSRGGHVQKNLRNLIKDAHKWKYLDSDLARAAHEIRKWGNGAVHPDSPKKRSIPRFSESRFFTRKLAEGALLHSKRILRHLCS